MSYKSKSTYTLPRKNELHTSIPRETHSRTNRREVKFGPDTVLEPRSLSRHFEEHELLSEQPEDEASRVRQMALDWLQEQSDASEDDKEAMEKELDSCFKERTDTMPDPNELLRYKQHQLYTSDATVDWSTLHSTAAKLHAQDRVLVPCQQKRMEMFQAIGMMNDITNCNFQGIGTGSECDSTISLAKQLAEQYNRNLTASEIIVLALRNYWFDNLELKIGDTFMHIDRYLFQYYAHAFRDHSSYYLELPSHRVPMNLMVAVYNWLINGNDKLLLDNNFLAMYTLAKFLDMRRLLEQFWFTFSMSGTSGFWEQNAFDAYLEARRMPCSDMMAILLSRIRKTFLPLIASLEFLEMSVNEVIYLFKLDTICVNSEDEMFFAAVRWLEYDWPKRKKYIVQIMARIRMRLLSPWLQRSIVHNPENKVIRKLGSNDHVKALLWDACLYGEAAVSYNKLRYACDTALQIKYSQANEVQRFWVYCQGVPHHHDVKCPHYRQLTYETFKLFLTCLQTHSQHFIDAISYAPQKHWNTYECCQQWDSESGKIKLGKTVRSPIYSCNYGS